MLYMKTFRDPAGKMFELGSCMSGKMLWLVGTSSFCAARGPAPELAGLESARFVKLIHDSSLQSNLPHEKGLLTPGFHVLPQC